MADELQLARKIKADLEQIRPDLIALQGPEASAAIARLCGRQDDWRTLAATDLGIRAMTTFYGEERT